MAANPNNRPQWRWYVTRLLAMHPSEVLRHLAVRTYQWADRRENLVFGSKPVGRFSPLYPVVPAKEAASEALRETLRQEADELLAGNWWLFGRRVAIPNTPTPSWQIDPLRGTDITSHAFSLDLNYRNPPSGADARGVWELNRWTNLTRLAQAAYLLGDVKCRDNCIIALQSWLETNPPYRGWNWRRTIEVAWRLQQFSWIHALLLAAGVDRGRVSDLAERVLPAHVRFLWRYRSFGSSANHTRLGELSALLTTLARWPSVSSHCAPPPLLASQWQTTVLDQFACDGGHREQSLRIHRVALEWCEEAIRALHTLDQDIAPEVSKRIALARAFYGTVQCCSDVWNYGDDDNAVVLPLGQRTETFDADFCQWCRTGANSAIQFWRGETPPAGKSKPGAAETKAAAAESKPASKSPEWTVFSETGIAALHYGDWLLRLDFSPLGYLSLAAHGHLDALHLSLWYKGHAVLVDPGTGGYYVDQERREQLSAWSAHNALVPDRLSYPQRVGLFQWGQHHARPVIEDWHGGTLAVSLQTPVGRMKRSVTFDAQALAVVVEDSFLPADSRADAHLVWTIRPGLRVFGVDTSTWAMINDQADWQVTLETTALTRAWQPPPTQDDDAVFARSAAEQSSRCPTRAELTRVPISQHWGEVARADAIRCMVVKRAMGVCITRFRAEAVVGTAKVPRLTPLDEVEEENEVEDDDEVGTGDQPSIERSPGGSAPPSHATAG